MFLPLPGIPFLLPWPGNSYRFINTLSQWGCFLYTLYMPSLQPFPHWEILGLSAWSPSCPSDPELIQNREVIHLCVSSAENISANSQHIWAEWMHEWTNEWMRHRWSCWLSISHIPPISLCCPRYVDYAEGPHPLFSVSDISICISGTTGKH